MRITCPTCNGTGYDADGEPCQHCYESGLIQVAPDGWLYLPSELDWFNTAHIVAVNGWTDGSSSSVIVSYTITDIHGNEWEAEAADDLAAVRAWLEGRS